LVVFPRQAIWSFWLGDEWKWNNFDFIVVMLCMPFLEHLTGGNVAVLRLMRLARLVKIVKKVPQLQMIVMGLAGGLKSIGYILLLLFLVFYLYAILGMFVFRDNDPWHFGSLEISLLTLFRASTLEDWTDIMYISIFGCDLYASTYVTSPSFTDLNVDYWCKNPSSNYALAPFYWVSFIIVSALVMLSLFIGAVTMSMTESMDQMKEEQEAATRQRMKEKQMKKLAAGQEMQKKIDEQESANSSSSDGATPKVAKRSNSFSTTILGSLGFGEEQGSAYEEQEQMSRLLSSIWEGIHLEDVISLDRKMVTGHPVRVMYFKMSFYMAELRDKKWFQNFITFVILVCGVLVGLQTDKEFDARNKEILDLLDSAILYIFTVEILVKWIAEDIYPLRMFRSGWNVFDTLIVIGSYALANSSAGGMLAMLRLLRLLRVLKLVKAFPQLQVIVNALLMGITSIGFIGIILVLVFYMFAILGMILFKDNDPWHFGTLQSAMLTLFRCSTLEDWTDVMYINFFGCDQYGYSGWDDMKTLCTNPKPLGWVSGFYFVIFTILGALVLLTLFIGVVTTSMDEAQEQQREEQEIEENIKNIQEIELLSEAEIYTFRKVFSMLDLDGGGTIEEEELRIGLESIGKTPTDEELAQMMKDVDEDESGEIDPSEFVQFMVNLRKQDRESKDRNEAKEVKKEQKKIDKANNGYDFGEEEGGGEENGSPMSSLTAFDSSNNARVGSDNGDSMTPMGKSKKTALVPIAASQITPVKSMATVGAEHNFGLPVLQSPVNENWLEMSLDVGKGSKKVLPRIGGAKGSKIAPSG